MFYLFAKVVALTAVAASRGHLGAEVAGAATTTQAAQNLGLEEVVVAGYTCECFSLALALEQLEVHPPHTHYEKSRDEMIGVIAK